MAGASLTVMRVDDRIAALARRAGELAFLPVVTGRSG